MVEEKIVFVKEKETKGTWRYKEVENPETGEVMVGTIYIKKSTIAKLGRPEKIEVVIKGILL